MQLSNNLKTIHFRKHRKQAIEQEIGHVSHRLESLSSKISHCMAQCAAAGGQPGKGTRARLYGISSYSQLQDWFYSYFMMHIHLKSKSLSSEQLNIEHFIHLIVSVFQEKNKRSNDYIILLGTSEDKKMKWTPEFNFATEATYIKATQMDQRSTLSTENQNISTLLYLTVVVSLKLNN